VLQQTLFPPPSTWVAPRLAEMPQDWNVTRRLGLDTETCDPLLKKLGPGVRRGAYLAGISFALDPTTPHYLALKHLGGDNMEDPDQALGYVRDQAARYTGEVVGAKLSYDLDFLAEAGIEFPHATFLDVQVAEPLLDELQFSYSLENILERHGLPGKDETLLREACANFGLKDPKADLHKLPARYVGPYAEADAIRPMVLLAKQEKELAARGLEKIWALETAVLPVLVRMRRRGVRVDFDRLDRVERFAVAQETKAWGEVHRLTGVSVRVGDAMKATVVARALEAVDITVPSTPSTHKPSITKEWLEALKHPVASMIRRARQMSQLRSTFVNSIREHAIGDRIHCSFNQLKMEKDDGSNDAGSAYGRLSSDDPNMQQQPGRDPEIGPMWRAIFVPDSGGLWGQLDYSQQEPRIGLHLSIKSGPERIGRRAYHAALAEQEKYLNDPKADSHTIFTQMVHGDDVVNEPKSAFKFKRDKCKQVKLGIGYGSGGAKVCHSLGLPTRWIENKRTGQPLEVAGEEGQALLDLVESRAPHVKATANAVEAVAKERGHVVTLMGRHLHFPVDAQGRYDWTYRAYNRAVQGGAADQTKVATVELDRAGAYLQLQVHDELDVTLADEAEGRRHAEMMETCLPLEVPSRVDLGIGPSWGELVE
jgi:DNA polymerase I-like protein with 3'-5' exonuclease and polymerase domains